MAIAGFATISGFLVADRLAYPGAFKDFQSIATPAHSIPASTTATPSAANNLMRAPGVDERVASSDAAATDAASAQGWPTEPTTDTSDSNR